MTIAFPIGRLRASLARTEAEVTACQRLRHHCFFGGEGLDQDSYDARCQHLMVRDGQGALIATARLQFIPNGRNIHLSYAAQFHDFKGLSIIDKPMIEVGRFCIAPQALDADVLRIAWGALTDLVDAQNVRLLFGCASFKGTEPARYGRAFQKLFRRHLGPETLRPLPRGTDAVALHSIDPSGSDPLPPLLRTYLAMGGWVGDHLTIDDRMQTMHVFTCVDVQAVPPARAKALRALAQGAALS